MTLETINQENMKAVSELAKINLEISAGKEKLLDMKKDIGKFLSERDEQDRVRFDKLLEESSDLVEEIGKNHARVSSFYNNIKSYSGFLNEFCDSVKSGFSQLSNEHTEFTELVEREMSELSKIRKENDEIAKDIELDKKEIERQKKDIEKDKRHLESQREALKNSYEAERKLFDKLKKHE